MKIEPANEILVYRVLASETGRYLAADGQGYTSLPEHAMTFIELNHAEACAKAGVSDFVVADAVPVTVENLQKILPAIWNTAVTRAVDAGIGNEMEIWIPIKATSHSMPDDKELYGDKAAEIAADRAAEDKP